MIDWDAIDTVLLDMDGTLLDLHFDNYFWMDHLPRLYAEKHGMSLEDSSAHLQDAFHTRNSLQCGFCTAGMLMTAYELLQHVVHPSRQEIREYLAGNYCRCTGYEAIVDAIEQVATARADNRQGDQRV